MPQKHYPPAGARNRSRSLTPRLRATRSLELLELDRSPLGSRNHRRHPALKQVRQPGWRSVASSRTVNVNTETSVRCNSMHDQISTVITLPTTDGAKVGVNRPRVFSSRANTGGPTVVARHRLPNCPLPAGSQLPVSGNRTARQHADHRHDRPRPPAGPPTTVFSRPFRRTARCGPFAKDRGCHNIATRPYADPAQFDEISLKSASAFK